MLRCERLMSAGPRRVPSSRNCAVRSTSGRVKTPTMASSSSACSSSSSSSGGSGPSAEPALLGRRGALASLLVAAGLPLLPAAGPAAAKVSVVSVLKGKEGERDIETLASGVKVSRVSEGRGEAPAVGSTVLLDLVGYTEDGKVFYSTKAEGGAPIALQFGTTNKIVTDGLAQVLETMRAGDVRLAVVPAALGYGAAGATFKSGRRVPPNADLYYEVDMLRCQTFSLGMACCSDADYPCIKKDPSKEVTVT